MRCLALAFLSYLLITNAYAQELPSDNLTIAKSATLATPLSLKTAAIYLNVDNPDLESDLLLSASSPWSDSAELNQTAFENGRPKPFPVGNLVILPASVTVLGPGGGHIKLIGLRRSLQVDDMVPLTLVFAKAGTRDIETPVLSAHDFVRQYPIETMSLTLKNIRAEKIKNVMP